MQELTRQVFWVGGLVLLVCLVSLPAGAVEYDYGAALRQNVLLMRRPDGMETLYPDAGFGISETRLRLLSDARFDRGRFQFAAELRGNFVSLASSASPFSQNSGSILGTSRPLTLWDLRAEHMDTGSAALSSRIDRMDISWRFGAYDIDVGRQPVSLGTSHFVGVLDVVAPFAPGDLDATYKPGVDAVRVRRIVGMTGEVELIVVGDEDADNGAIIGRGRQSVFGMDIELLGGRFRRRGFGGVGWEGGIGDVAVWGEMALFERKKDRETWRAGWSEAAFSGVAGCEISALDNTIFGAGVFYQDFGVRDPEELATVYDDAPFREGWVFLGAAAYGVLTAHRQLHPLVTLDVSGLVNMVDASTLWQPSFTISTGDNTDLNVYGWLGTGEESRATAGGMDIESEFGMLPAGGGMYARWFF